MIRIAQSNQNLHVIISDNGIGREAAAQIKAQKQLSANRQSFGIRLVQDRFDLLSAQNHKPYKLEISDIIDNSGAVAGTQIEIFLPLE